MSNRYDDLDEYEHFDPERRKWGKGGGELMERRLERAIREKKLLRKRLVRARQQAHRGTGRKRPPNREE